MSFLGGGSADCGPVNPMAGLMKQFGQDRSLQQVLFFWLTFVVIVDLLYHSIV